MCGCVLIDTIIRARYFYRCLVEDWYINLDQMQKDGKRIIQISEIETTLSRRSEYICIYGICENNKINRISRDVLEMLKIIAHLTLY